ncbi:MAG: hypothetical protein IAG13_18870 [Deltaproteobacteria bacterium]|nr:hypothetical protein [Nannocystaceae bacterium]
MSSRAGGLAMLAVLGCRPAASTTVSKPDDAAHEALPTSRHAAGEVLDANIPLAHGGVLPLASLRGKVVILELGGAADRDATVEADYAALAQSSGASLAIVMVALDPGGWHDDAPPHTLGWDPQGALAAKLRAASLPTVIVLDAQGRIAHQYGGARTSGHAEAIATAKRLLTAPGR